MMTLQHNDIWRRDFDISTSLYNDISIRKWRPANIAAAFLLAAAMLTGCGGSSDSFEDEPQNVTDNESPQEIRLKADVWRMMEGTRATFYETGTLASGSFTAAAYSANTTTAYFTPVTVNWDTDKWIFSDGKHYWPSEGALDFFAYMPAAVPSYITDMSDVASLVTYTARNPQFKCKNLPMTYDSESSSAGQGSGLQEFVYALKTNRTKALDGASGVTLDFLHPFTKIILQLSSTQADIHINKITLKGIKNNGTYAHSSGWTPTGDATNLVLTLDGNYSANDVIGTLLMIPQDWAGEIEVNATWTDWGAQLPHILKTTKATTWAAGTSYTYTFTITETDLIVNTTKFTEQW